MQKAKSLIPNIAWYRARAQMTIIRGTAQLEPSFIQRTGPRLGKSSSRTTLDAATVGPVMPEVESYNPIGKGSTDCSTRSNAIDPCNLRDSYLDFVHRS